jgi:RNA polymerase sigma factor for flagellar operon FliA
MKAEIRKYQRISRIDPENMNEKRREELILKNAPLVKAVAERLAVRLPPHISREELISAGIIGLFDALKKFDTDKGIKFRTYAEFRIKGAMLDELRKMDWVSRSVRKDIHRIEGAMINLGSKLGREPEDFEVAQEIGVDLDCYHRMTTRAQGAGLLSLEDVMADDTLPKFLNHTSTAPSPLDELKIKEIKKIISDAISKLTEKEQRIISLYYYDELTLKEIATILNLTESRISQIHSKVIIKLRAKLRSYYES